MTPKSNVLRAGVLKVPFMSRQIIANSISQIQITTPYKTIL